MATTKLRFRHQDPVALAQLRKLSDATLARTARAGGSVLDYTVETAQVDDTVAAFAAFGYALLSTNPTTDPDVDNVALPTQFAFATSLGRSATTAATPQTKVTLTAPSTLNGTYLVITTLAYDCPENRGVYYQLLESPGATVLNQRTALSYASSLALVSPAASFAVRTWSNQAGVSYALQYWSEQNGKEVGVRDARIAMWRVA